MVDFDLHPKLYKEDVYVAYEDFDSNSMGIWGLLPVAKKFIELYKDGFKAVTHHDKQYDTLYVLNENGDYYVHPHQSFSELEYKGAHVKTAGELIHLIHGSEYDVVWFTPDSGQQYLITKDDPIYTFVYHQLTDNFKLFPQFRKYPKDD